MRSGSPNRQRQFRRRVALKVIKAGMDTAQVVARFEAERQALALMDHPNVAQVFDAGATLQGRPYFVMEYVPGAQHHRLLRHPRLDNSQRIGLLYLSVRRPCSMPIKRESSIAI